MIVHHVIPVSLKASVYAKEWMLQEVPGVPLSLHTDGIALWSKQHICNQLGHGSFKNSKYLYTRVSHASFGNGPMDKLRKPSSLDCQICGGYLDNVNAW